MKALIHVTDVVEGLRPVDLTPATFEPILPGYLRVDVPPSAKPGDVVFLLIKATVQIVLPG